MRFFSNHAFKISVIIKTIYIRLEKYKVSERSLSHLMQRGSEKGKSFSAFHTIRKKSTQLELLNVHEVKYLYAVLSIYEWLTPISLFHSNL